MHAPPRVSLRWWPKGDRYRPTLEFELGPQQNALLALLLISSPYLFVGYPEIIEVLWPDPDEQPLGAKKIIQKHIHELRQFGILIDTRSPRGTFFRDEPNGYRIPKHGRA